MTQTTTQTQYTSYLSNSIHLSSGTLPPLTTDLCHTIKKKGKHKTPATTGCFGSISCKSRRFNLYHQDCRPDHVSTVYLSTILDDREHGGGLIKFNYVERPKLTLSLSYSVLHLHKTPWLANTVGPEDITFLGEQQQVPRKAACLPGRPFLAKTLPSGTSDEGQIQPMQAEGRPMDLTILSLGLLLIQIMIGRRIGDLAPAPDMRMSLTLSKKRGSFEVHGIRHGKWRYELRSRGPVVSREHLVCGLPRRRENSHRISIMLLLQDWAVM